MYYQKVSHFSKIMKYNLAALIWRYFSSNCIFNYDIQQILNRLLDSQKYDSDYLFFYVYYIHTYYAHEIGVFCRGCSRVFPNFMYDYFQRRYFYRQHDIIYPYKIVTYILFTENFPTIDQSNSCNAADHNRQRIGYNQEIQSGNFLISICDI